MEDRNDLQKHRLFEKITDYYGNDLSGLTFALWGLSFKPGTDDMREAPSKVLLHDLIGQGARIKAYDPVAMEVARKELPADWFNHNHLQLADNEYDVFPDTDALILITEWKPFRNPDFGRLKELMKGAAIFDGRNQYDPAHVASMGFDYRGIGR